MAKTELVRLFFDTPTEVCLYVNNENIKPVSIVFNGRQYVLFYYYTTRFS